MKPAFRTAMVICVTVLSGKTALLQTTGKSFEKSIKMETIKNKEAIHFLYDTILNLKQFDQLSAVIAADYSSLYGGKGVAGFQKPVQELSKAFADAQWKTEMVIAEGNRVVVKQVFTGKHTGQFQGIRPTNKTVSVNGFVSYQFQDGKITSSEVQTDRVTFLQQLGALPEDISRTYSSEVFKEAVYFVDKFTISHNSFDEFYKQMNYNRSLIKKLPGFIKDLVLTQEGKDGNIVLMTVAMWESQEKLDAAKLAVQDNYKKIGFDPAAFLQRLNIQMERTQFKSLIR